VRHDNFRLIHGDFHPENIFVNGPRVTVTDFERSCLFDPAADLGFFLCQFEAKVRMGRYALGELERARLRRHFMDGYASQAPETLAWRVGLYEARGYLEIAHYIYCGLHVPADPAEFEFYVQSAERSAGSVA
jgi:aminoglycoside phosphotransferase (APT) family kinase protein